MVSGRSKQHSVGLAQACPNYPQIKLNFNTGMPECVLSLCNAGNKVRFTWRIGKVGFNGMPTLLIQSTFFHCQKKVVEI